METKKTNKKLIVFDLDETLVHAFKPTDLPKEMTEQLRSDMRKRSEVAKQQNVNPDLYDQPHMFLMMKETKKTQDDPAF